MNNGLNMKLIVILVICTILYISSVYTVLILLLIDDQPEEEGIRIDNDHYPGTPRAFLKPKLDPDDPLNVSFSLVVYCKEYQGWTTYINMGDGSPLYNLTSNLTVHRYPSIMKYKVTYWTLFRPTDYPVRRSIILDLAKAGNMTPVAVIVEEEITTKNRNQPVLISGNASFDVDGEIIGFYWDYGDGTHSDITQGIHGYLPGPVTSHAYDKIGKYEVTLSVMDDQGYDSSFDDAARITVTVHW
ncbi:MAG: PKD domain-containing protein [Candidatus Thermoplasmatota archaeon]|nr:PKD domain-containing protein [Candidatus Thermoplasmatota archaeon]